MPSSVSPTKRLLVTGGRGRLATLVSEQFRASGHDVRSYSRQAGNGHLPLGQLMSPPGLVGADVLLHLAWSTLPATAEHGAGGIVHPDLQLLESLLRNLAEMPAPARPHFVFFSSGGTVYGNAAGRPSRETDACAPLGRYGRDKLAAEEIIRNAAERHQLPCTILRIANPYGYPVPRERIQGVIPHAIRCALEGQPLSLWGDGRARKDFIHYTDFLAALAQVIERRLTGVFNIGAGESHSVAEIISLVEQQTGRRIATQATPAPAWDVQDSRLDIAQFRAATSWTPQVTLAEGIRRSVAAVASA
jgi:UDP-glucose 4-epimerase